MNAYLNIRSSQYVGTLISLSLMVAGCSMFSGEAKLQKNAKGSVYLKEIADWSFEANHPATIDQMTMLKIVKGVVTDDVQKMTGNMPASGSKPMRVFSDEDAEFLAPLLAQGLSQAKPEQIVGFKVSPSAGSGTEPTAGTLYMSKGSIHLTIASSQNRKVTGFTPSSAARLEKAPSFIALGSGAMTMIIDHQALAKGPMPGSPAAASASKAAPVSASQAASVAPSAIPAPISSAAKVSPSLDDSLLDPQEFHGHSRKELGTPESASDELLNRKLDELRQAREANKLKDSEIAMLKKEAAWMKQELRQRAEEVKAMKASKTVTKSIPKKKSAEAYPTR
ncbi:MAG: hypothetical protein A4E19_14870 [Nitrospira sp. SG-bin1]|nr:MAG: hypothetical protein A4E19_14870 [Nitrospira sp. SG-bin1]